MDDWCPENDGAYRAEMAAMYPVANRKRIEELEAKLAKVVDALERLVALNDDYSPFGGELLQDRVERTWQKARTTLAELKGQKDE